MNFFVSATPTPLPKTKNVRAISIACAAVITIMAVAQLFTYEKFPAAIAALALPGGVGMAHLLAALIVILEVCSLPFLLAMRLSPTMRVVSMVAGWLVGTTWLKISLWENIFHASTFNNSALLGATLPLPVGWWSVLWCLALGVLVAWSAWGMWPFKTRTKGTNTST